MPEIDFTSGAWLAVAAWAKDEIERARVRNDGDLDTEKTAALRGEIKAFKKLLGLPSAAARARSAESADPSLFSGPGH